MDNTEENVQTLLNMGFPVESEIRRALKIAKNDLSEAVAILTNDTPVGNYDALDDLDVEMKDVGSGPMLSSGDSGALVPYGPALPPSYEQAVELEAAVSTHTSLLTSCNTCSDGRGGVQAEGAGLSCWGSLLCCRITQRFNM